MNEIITTDIIKVDDIKTTFYILFWRAYGRKQFYTSEPVNVVYSRRKTKDRNKDGSPVYRLGGRLRQPFLYPSLSYKFITQDKILSEAEIELKEIQDNINQLVAMKIVPEKFFVAYKRIPVTYKVVPKFDIECYMMRFPVALISYLEQTIELGRVTPYQIDRYKLKEILNVFKRLNEHSEGIEFEEYIERWVDRLVETDEELKKIVSKQKAHNLHSV